MKNFTALSLAVALPLAAAAPAPVPAAAAPATAPSSNHVLRTAKLTAEDLSKRDDEIPDQCMAMIDTRQSGAPEWLFYWFDDEPDKCAAEESSGTRNCGDDGYWDTQLDDMTKSIADQTTKDGQFESSTVGMWSSTFGTLTSAIPDRDAFADFTSRMLRERIASVPEPRRSWSYRFIIGHNIIHLNLDNGGVFDKNCPDAA